VPIAGRRFMRITSTADLAKRYGSASQPFRDGREDDGGLSPNRYLSRRSSSSSEGGWLGKPVLAMNPPGVNAGVGESGSSARSGITKRYGSASQPFRDGRQADGGCPQTAACRAVARLRAEAGAAASLLVRRSLGEGGRLASQPFRVHPPSLERRRDYVLDRAKAAPLQQSLFTALAPLIMPIRVAAAQSQVVDIACDNGGQTGSQFGGKRNYQARRVLA
jgi:hypothetical protein